MRFTWNGRRYDTARMTDVDIRTRERGGTWIEGVYMMPRARRVFVATHSIWDRGDGRTVGTQVHEADADEIASLASRHDCDALYELVPEGRDDAEPDRAAELRRKRAAAGMTQAQFAAAIGVDPNSIARMEREEIGISEPVLRMARVVADRAGQD